MAKRRGFPPVYKIERVEKMSAKRVFFGVLQKIMVICCVIFFGFANAFSANLPSEYTELEYIKTTGTQYINTGINNTGSIGFETEVSAEIYGRELGLIATSTSSSGPHYVMQAHSGSLKFYWANGSGPIIFTDDHNMHHISFNTTGDTKAYTDGTLVGTITSLFPTDINYPFYLFARDVAGSLKSDSAGQFTCKYFKIYRDGNLIAHFIPAKNSSGVVGMYDLVSGQFFTNQGTGEFTAGPAKCRNLFDKTTVTANEYITPSGSITSDGTNRTVVSGEIYVKPSTTYTLSGVGNIYDASYNRSGFQYQADGTPISAITATQNTGIVTFTTDANCAYVRVMSVTANVDTAMLEEGSTATAYVPFCAQEIKIATTAYNAARFNQVKTDLNSAVATIREIVTKTINQTAAIASLQADKQTRPDEQCPAGKKCLLVETEENGVIVPHWFPIIENIYGLPSGYTPLEYIQSDGNSWIDTEVQTNLSNVVEVQYSNIIRESGSHLLFGSYISGNNTVKFAYNFVGDQDNTGGLFYCGLEAYRISTPPTNDGLTHIIKLGNGRLVVDDIVVRTNLPTDMTGMSGSAPIYLFNSASSSYPTKGRIHYAKITNADDIIRNFVPAKRNSDDAIGMYDTVTNTFFTNAGTGTFTAGPEI